jgi:hypothetical protein
MMNGTTQLSSTNKFFISADGISYKSADEAISYNGTANDASAKALPLYVKQTISGNEPAGTFQITIAFTASIP